MLKALRDNHILTELYKPTESGIGDAKPIPNCGQTEDGIVYYFMEALLTIEPEFSKTDQRTFIVSEHDLIAMEE